jgi:hypothetical protein
MSSPRSPRPGGPPRPSPHDRLANSTPGNFSQSSSHKIAPVQNLDFEHDDASQTRLKLESEAARFRDTSMTHEAQRSTGAAPRVEGEHVHHHGMIKVLSPRLPTVFGSPSIVHESVQPEIVQTTVPIHKVHRADEEDGGIYCRGRHPHWRRPEST